MSGAGGAGGGISNYEGILSLFDDSSVNSNATLDGNSNGGGIYNQGVSATLLLTKRTTVYANTTGIRGGGIFNDYGIVTLSDSAQVHHNSAAQPSSTGGGIFNEGGTVTIKGSSGVMYNSASSLGGGIYNNTANNHTGTVKLSGTATITKNSVTATTNGDLCGGGGIYDSGELYINEARTCGIDKYNIGPGNVFIDGNTAPSNICYSHGCL